ncbi:MAG: hypothetical protein M3O91_05925 [Chloroflexota bacterium]|nr:hypothetical protein [Chloroflexota bacterium]
MTIGVGRGVGDPVPPGAAPAVGAAVAASGATVGRGAWVAVTPSSPRSTARKGPIIRTGAGAGAAAGAGVAVAAGATIGAGVADTLSTICGNGELAGPFDGWM